MPIPISRLLGIRMDSPPDRTIANQFSMSNIFPFRSKAPLVAKAKTDFVLIEKRYESFDSTDGDCATTSPDSTFEDDSDTGRRTDSPTQVGKLVGMPSKLFHSIKENLNKNRLASSRQRDSANVQKKSLKEEQFEVAVVIERYLVETFKGKHEPHPLFIGSNEAPISFLKYIERLIILTNKWVEEEDGPHSLGVRCALLAVEYLERVDVKLSSLSYHRYFMTAFLIGIKLLFDYYMSNSFWAEVSGCPRKQVNQMEIQLCNSLNWNFTVSVEKHEESVRKFVKC